MRAGIKGKLLLEGATGARGATVRLAIAQGPWNMMPVPRATRRLDIPPYAEELLVSDSGEFSASNLTPTPTPQTLSFSAPGAVFQTRTLVLKPGKTRDLRTIRLERAISIVVSYRDASSPPFTQAPLGRRTVLGGGRLGAVNAEGAPFDLQFVQQDRRITGFSSAFSMSLMADLGPGKLDDFLEVNPTSVGFAALNKVVPQPGHVYLLDQKFFKHWVLFQFELDPDANGVGASRGDDTKAQEIRGWGTVIDPARDCKVIEKEGTLATTVPGTHHNLNQTPAFDNLLAPRVLQDVDGDFTLHVKVDPFERPEPGTSTNGRNSFVGAGLLVWQDGKNFIRFLRAANGESGRLFAQVEFYQEGMFAGGDLSDLDDKSTHLRLSRNGNTFTFAVSEDGKQWTELQTEVKNVALPKNVKVGVAAINSTAREFAPRFEALALTAK
jgi:regulation of enolase protein 1 (concanavalin A-like superfamily)